MAERVINQLEPEIPAPLTAEQAAAAIAETEAFIRDVAPHFGRLFGMELRMQVGNLGEGAGMATTENGEVVIDPRFFVETGKGDKQVAEYGILHETAAHLRTIVTNPALTKRVADFVKQPDTVNASLPAEKRPADEKRAIFYNILADVAGNNLIHAALPRMQGVAKRLYADKLFDKTDYSEFPRHLQFLYKLIRQEMVPGEAVTVSPEVDSALGGLRDYEGQGDLIKYSTSVAKSAREAMSAEEQFGIWIKIIYPVYEQLVEQDRQDPDRQSQSDQAGDGQPSDGNQPQPGQPGEQAGDPQPQQSGENAQSAQGTEQSPQVDNQRFGSYYDDYHQNRHPEPMSDGDKDNLQEQATTQQKAKQSSPETPDQRLRAQETALDKKTRAETGHSLREQQHYNAEVNKWQSAIGEMRDVFQQVINERLAQKRGLSRRTFTEGAVLDPDRLVQTFIDVRNNVEQPEAFRDYETRKGETTAIGKTDYVFVFDTSGSMQGEKALAAASSAVIGLEGLAALQRDVEAAEATYKVDLELDVRTAIYTFGSGSECLKPLATTLSSKERLDAYAAVGTPNGGSTQDFVALEEVEKLPSEPDRRRIMIVVSDGESDDTSRARRSVDRLRGAGWFVYGISIGSAAAENLYRPTARRVDDPTKLPETIQTFIEATVS